MSLPAAPHAPARPSALFSSVLEVEPAAPEVAVAHFAHRLAVETDPADVRADLGKGIDSFVLVDARSPEDFAECHIPGAVNLPHRRIRRETTEALDPAKPIVVYCWGPGCNAATKAARRFALLGFRVKEMIGGIEYWRREGGEVAGTRGERAPLCK